MSSHAKREKDRQAGEREDGRRERGGQIERNVLVRVN